MKKKYLITLFLLIYTIAFTQTKRFFYKMEFKPNPDVVVHEVCVLDIEDESNLFYSYEFLLVDSLNQRREFHFAYPKFKKVVKWNKSTSDFTFTESLGMNSYKYNSKKPIIWDLKNETKKIGNYKVQKATCDYGGRTWEAWFSNELPFSYGPYVFQGLPGMILEVYDKVYDYHFTFIQNKNFSKTQGAENVIKQFVGINENRINEKDWKKLKINYYNNPIPEYKSGDAIMFDEKGRQLTGNDFVTMEKSIKSDIKNNNNPIELSDKIEYN